MNVVLQILMNVLNQQLISVTKSLVIVQILHLGIPVLVRVDTQVMGLHVQVSYTCSCQSF
jgi:hypothetical protein